jgi:hypothetical protein
MSEGKSFYHFLFVVALTYLLANQLLVLLLRINWLGLYINSAHLYFLFHHNKQWLGPTFLAAKLQTAFLFLFLFLKKHRYSTHTFKFFVELDTVIQLEVIFSKNYKKKKSWKTTAFNCFMWLLKK